jgi:hypothetical protein
MKLILFLSLLFPVPLFVVAQNEPGVQLKIKKAKKEIKLDGVLDESDWIDADVADNWYLNYPVDTARAPFQTEARLTFNDDFLYVSYVCYDNETPDLINSLRRDFDYERNDNVGMTLGPYNDKINGFFFVITPRGVQMEGTVSAGGSSDNSYNISWDNKWYSKVVRYKDKWIVEIALPFKSFRYKSDIREWNIAFDRLDKKRNFKSAWIRTPIQYPTASFAYSGQLVWEDPIPKPKTNISLIPYIAGRTSGEYETDPDTHNSELQGGLDAKIGVTPSMNLDLTVNPDFSQVEVDQQVINLTRFEFRFPERRQFFLENSDLFEQAGFPDTRMFFSRRIGLVKDSTGLYTRVPITYGVRLSGSVTPKWRVNLLNMQTKEKKAIGLPSQNYAVAAVQRNFWAQSNITLTYADKEMLGVGQGDSTRYFHESVFQPFTENGKSFLKRNAYNRSMGVDLESLSKDNKWYASAYASQSFTPITRDHNHSAGAFLQYSVRSINAFVGHYSIGKNFNSEMGYVPSHNVYPGQLNYLGGVTYKIYPKNKAVVLMSPNVSFTHTYLPTGILSDKNYTLGYNFNFLNTMIVQLAYNYIFQRMTSDFNPVDADKYTSYVAGEKYNWQNFSVLFQSDTRKIVNFTTQATYGGFYNGTNFNINGQLNARYQPYGNLSLRFDFNDLRLPENYGRERLFLIGPKFDVTFTDKLFLTTYIQYNNLLDNVNLNARFQWRYKPASDFFIVYTENYLPDNLKSKNRALVFKLTYWFNL